MPPPPGTLTASQYSHVARSGYTAEDWASLPPVLRPAATSRVARTERRLVAIPLRHARWGVLETLVAWVEIERAERTTMAEELAL
jgi:hypothetical protein